MKTKAITLLLVVFFGIFTNACQKNEDELIEDTNKSWTEVLKGIHLSHIESGSSLNPDYTKSTQAYLCSNGNFYMSVIDSITGSEFYGIWQVENKPISQSALLTVQFSDGDVRQYQLSFSNGKISIDGTVFQFEYNQSGCDF